MTGREKPLTPAQIALLALRAFVEAGYAMEGQDVDGEAASHLMEHLKAVRMIAEESPEAWAEQYGRYRAHIGLTMDTMVLDAAVDPGRASIGDRGLDLEVALAGPEGLRRRVLRAARERAEVSVAEAADKAGLDVAAWEELERTGATEAEGELVAAAAAVGVAAGAMVADSERPHLWMPTLVGACVVHGVMSRRDADALLSHLNMIVFDEKIPALFADPKGLAGMEELLRHEAQEDLRRVVVDLAGPDVEKAPDWFLGFADMAWVAGRDAEGGVDAENPEEALAVAKALLDAGDAIGAAELLAGLGEVELDVARFRAMAEEMPSRPWDRVKAVTTRAFVWLMGLDEEEWTSVAERVFTDLTAVLDEVSEGVSVSGLGPLVMGLLTCEAGGFERMLDAVDVRPLSHADRFAAWASVPRGVYEVVSVYPLRVRDVVDGREVEPACLPWDVKIGERWCLHIGDLDGEPVLLSGAFSLSAQEEEKVLELVGRRDPTEIAGWVRRSYAARRDLTAKKGAVGRNQPCPCGSGRKHKKCCGR